MQRVLRFLSIYSKLKNKRDIAKKTKKYRGGEIQLAPIVFLSAARLTYVSYCNSYKPLIPSQLINLIQQKRQYLYLVRKIKHPFYILQLKLYSQYIKKEMFSHKRIMWSEYCKTINSCDVKQFWKRSHRHFSSYCPPIEAFI